VAARADHGQKQVTSGRTDRDSLTQGPITEADIAFPLPGREGIGVGARSALVLTARHGSPG